ncbi:MAG: response regulator [Gemmatimonadales bacterium]|nr:response regulator [Gemmatimonadales bacterium]
MRALIVDDSRAIRAMVGRIMAELGFETIDAGDGRAALERLEQGPTPDVCLVDWNMPVMNGIEFVQALRADPRWADVKVVMVTTETEVSQMVRALEAGANEYVMKPFTRDVIREKLGLLALDVA